MHGKTTRARSSEERLTDETKRLHQLHPGQAPLQSGGMASGSPRPNGSVTTQRTKSHVAVSLHGKEPLCLIRHAWPPSSSKSASWPHPCPQLNAQSHQSTCPCAAAAAPCSICLQAWAPKRRSSRPAAAQAPPTLTSAHPPSRRSRGCSAPPPCSATTPRS